MSQDAAPTITKDHPVYKNQSGAIEMAVWANTREVDGQQRTFHSVTLQRSYLDKDEKWQKTPQLRQRDLGDAIALLQTAQQFLMKDTAA